MKLLRVDSSARRNSVSRQLTQAFVETWKKKNPAGEVIERDLASTHLPPITDEWTLAIHSDPATLTPAQRETISVSDALVDELLAAGTIVIGAPMYNFTISAPLKAWIDQIVRVGRTVLFGQKGPRGVLTGKKVVVVTSRGGAYRAGTPTATYDYQEQYLRHILAFIGLTDVTFIHAENQKPGDLAEPARAAAIEQAQLAASATDRPVTAQDLQL
ncbi:MAG: FMN-dependent NADH-azoreductase [Candidatus Sulfotelmatobacter sp.]|jgi:FMN-dependent NADH-azoreductase